MRVAVQHTDPKHPNHGVAAYRFGRVQNTPHPLTGENLKADDIMVSLLDQAREEFPEPEYRVWPERLSEPDEDGESTWDEIDEDALRLRAAGEPVEVGLLYEAGEAVTHSLSADQPTDTLVED